MAQAITHNHDTHLHWSRVASVAQFDAVPALSIYLALLIFIPAVWVLPGLGAAGPPASVFGMGLFGLWACIQLLPTVRTNRTWLRWPLLFYTLVLLVSYALGQDRGLSEAESLAADRALLQMVSFNGVLLMVSEGMPSTAHLERFARRMTYFAGVLAFVGMVQFFFRFDPFAYISWPGLTLNSDIAGLAGRGSNSLIRVKASTLHPIEFSTVMALALPLALHDAIHEVDRLIRRRRYALAAMIGVASLLAVSRTAVIGVAFVAMVMVWAWSPRFRLKAMGFGLIGLVAVQVAIPGLLGTLRYLFSNLANDDSVTGRTDDYAIVGAYVAERPWFGRGTGTFLPEQYILLDNSYLFRLVSTGYVGLASWLLLIAGTFLLARHAVRNHPSNRTRHLAVSLAAAIAAGAVTGATFDLYAFPTASGYFALSMGMAAILGRIKQPIAVVDAPAPAGAMRIAYRRETGGHRWWHRFDPEFRNRA